LGKNEGFICILNLVLFILLRRAMCMWGFLLACRCLLVEERETCIDCLGVVVVAVTILIFEICAEVTKTLAMGPAEHECSKIFITSSEDSKGTFSIGRIHCISNLPGSGKLVDFFQKKSGNHPYYSDTSIGFKSFDMGKEFPVVGVIVHAIFLIVGEEPLVGGDSSHDPLCFCIKQAAVTLNEFSKGDDVLRAANGCKGIGGFEVIFESWGALMVSNDVCLGHVLIVLVFPILGLVVFTLPQVEVNFSDREASGSRHVLSIWFANRHRRKCNDHR
jgi:hypothetical protein